MNFCCCRCRDQQTTANGTHLPCAKTRIQECGCYCSADDYTTVKANITEMVPVRRHTTTLVHPCHHHQPHSCTSTSNPLHVTMRLVHQSPQTYSPGKDISRQREGVETPTSPLIVLRHAGKRLTLVTINSDFFRTTCGSGVATSHARTPNHNDGAKYLSTAHDCQTNCCAQPPRELVVLEWSQHDRELVMVVSIWSFF